MLSSPPDTDRLFAIDQALRDEAQDVLARSGIGAILTAAGFLPVGSQAMHTMVWRDLDFERHREPDPGDHWDVGTRLAGTGWCTRMQFVDMYRERDHSEFGLYWGVRVADPARAAPAPKDDPTVWKLDIWTARPHEFDTEPRGRWASLMTEERRAEVLAIKEAVYRMPEYRKSLLSVHIYEAVLERHIRGLDEFLDWWRREKCDTIPQRRERL